VNCASDSPSGIATTEHQQAAGLRVGFVLPKGAYATTVLANVFDLAVEDTNGDATQHDEAAGGSNPVAFREATSEEQ